MALSRTTGSRRVENYTWPGFVDALATLLMVIIFVLMVFVLIQVNLAYRVSGQDNTLSAMRQQLASLTELLNLERNASADLAANLAQINNQLALSNAENEKVSSQLAIVTSDLDARNAEIDRLMLLQSDTETALNKVQKNLAERDERIQIAEGTLAIAEARTKTDSQTIETLKAETNASRAEIAQMTNALAALRAQLESLQNLLAEKEAQATKDKIAIANLGKSLNNALASRVQELQRFRSEFFGRLRDILKGRNDVQIVGDRFVFQSEVLFAAGQADIGDSGREQMTKLAVALAEIAREIPDDINWVLQVDGHTDDIPIRAGRYADNWDLSTERALSVVRFLISQGLPPNRLAATGYGEHQPLIDEDNEDARQKNRRIELKITQRVSAR
ncbi:peptidoglycan-binding protein [Alphaproteobacteria bacterium]|nr:peptidoglycan-binding protein [Alphaproteobacteria bacterium]